MTDDLTRRTLRRLTWRWSLFGAALIALFWGCWCLIAGGVPDASLMNVRDMALTRWADVLIAPIWSVAGIMTLKLVAATESWDDDYLLPFVCILVWCGTLIFALITGVANGVLLYVSAIVAIAAVYGMCALAILMVVLTLKLPPVRYLLLWLLGE